MKETSPGEPKALVQHAGFVESVLWNWFGNVTTLLAAFFVSPLMIQKLGESGYGLWVVVGGMMEYYWLLDFGMRGAVVRFSSLHNARGDTDQLNRVLNTASAYGLGLIPLIVIGAWLGGPWLGDKLNVQNPLFPELFFVVSVCLSLVSLFGTSTACLEGLQSFGIINKTAAWSVLVRTLGVISLLTLGYGVLQVGYVTALSQVGMHAVNVLYLRGLFPGLRIGTRFVQWGTFVEMMRYGFHGVVSSIGQRILNQSPQLMLTYHLSERFAGYYGNARMVLDYSAELVTRTGRVSNPRATQMLATGRQHEVARLAVTVNQFSLMLYLPLTVFLAAYSRPFLTVWIKRPDFAAQVAPVLLSLLIGHTFGIAGQYTCQSVLFGMARHQALSRLLLAEAVVGVAGMAWIVPNYGILPAAMWNSGLLLLNRGMIVPWLLTKALEVSWVRYMLDVNRPILAALPVYGLALLLQRALPGDNWPQLIAAGVLITGMYAPLAYLCILPEDRDLLWTYCDRVRRAVPFLPARKSSVR